ncbi:hypothetical protein ACSW9O_15410 (plasmid) [Clostridium perfringens]
MMKMNKETREMINTPGSRPNDGYYIFEEQIKEMFNQAIENDSILVKTKVLGEDLWETYLNAIPEEDGARQHYNCNACKHFITRYGSIAIVNKDGSVTSALWNPSVAPKFFMNAAKALKKEVENKPVESILLVDDRVLGIPKTGEWTHISAELPARYRAINKNRTKTANQVLADKKEEARLLSIAINDFDFEIIQAAIDMLESDSLYRGERFLPMIGWFKNVKEGLKSITNSIRRKNLIIVLAANAPEGFARIKNTVVGELLYDLKDGLSTRDIIARFNSKMNPSNYMRSQSDPSVNDIAEAEKVIESLGLASSLERRYLRIEEIPEEEIMWKYKSTKTKDSMVTTQAPLTSSGVFRGVLNKVEKTSTSKGRNDIPATTMTWEKFKRTILPKADTIEAKIDNQDKLMALVTAANPEAENILQWSNPVSWYYHGGIDSEIKRRVEAEGGRYENNEIRCSLIWNSYTDLDIHCYTPNGREIYFGNKRADNGYLDIDMNACGKDSITPVENIRWQYNAPNGRYKFFVHNYEDRNNGDNPFKVELQIKDKVFTFEGNADRRYRETVFEFDYYNGEVTMLSENKSFSTAESWNLDNNQFVKVNVITKSPNLWGDNNLEQFGNHTFFILDGCKDTSEGKGRGFFNEMLISDLRPIRKTLEAFTSMTPIEGLEDVTACGLGFSNNGNWNLILRVRTKDGGTKLIKIDRLD